MDAGIMDGSNLLFGAVGAMPGIRNPVEVARLLVREQTKGLLPLGRVPPIFMVGEGARDWAVRHGMATVKDDSELISEKANKLFRHYKKKLDSYRQVKEEVPATGSVTRRGKEDEDREERRLKHGKRKSTANAPESDGTSLKCSRQEEEEKNGRGEMEVEEKESLDDRVTDTVGVVVMDVQGNVASTVSSGGIALKQPGRVGQVGQRERERERKRQTELRKFAISVPSSTIYLLGRLLSSVVAAGLRTAWAARGSPSG